ncbi:MAG TPA: hypothetical protein VFF03_19395, partial [Rhodocyclaceae bacterium]|nr:hypothetical protein [Rhodocyclaceae bacterium]
QVFERIYQPLPVAVESAGLEEALAAPGPENLGRFFGPGVRAVQIVAVGGAGKTTLAMQLCRWLLGQGGQPLGRFARLPLWLDQEVADLKEVVDAKLRLLLEEYAPDAEWRDILLNRGRLCLVADRLSEQPKATQGKVCAFHENWPGGLLVLTARRPMDLPLPAVHLRPLPLDSLFAITGFIDRRLRSKGGEVELQAQTDIANALVQALLAAPAGPGKALGATPLMVELIADTALLLFKEGKGLEELPNSVPDIYFSYVRHLLRFQEAGEDAAADGAAQALLDAAYALAIASVGERFSPQAFSRNRVMAAQKGNSVLAEAQTFAALEKAGLLQSPVQVGNDAMYRFLLDPVAEYLAAFGYADECGGDRQRWRDLLAKVGEREESKGFRLALENIYRAYRDLKGYPDGVYPDGLESRQPPNPPELI